MRFAPAFLFLGEMVSLGFFRVGGENQIPFVPSAAEKPVPVPFVETINNGSLDACHDCLDTVLRCGLQPTPEEQQNCENLKQAFLTTSRSNCHVQDFLGNAEIRDIRQLAPALLSCQSLCANPPFDLFAEGFQRPFVVDAQPRQ